MRELIIMMKMGGEALQISPASPVRFKVRSTDTFLAMANP